MKYYPMFMKQRPTIKKPALQNQYVDLISSLLESMEWIDPEVLMEL
jgi:hypothetical protein